MALVESADQALREVEAAGRNLIGEGLNLGAECGALSRALTEEPSARPPTVLIVDDSPHELKFMAESLGTEFELLLAANGQRALELASQRNPDLVLLDVLMPDMDGYEVSRRFKADPKLETIPIVFLTSTDEIETEAQCLRLGAADCIAKPANPELLRLRVNNHLRQKRLYDRDRALVVQLRTALADITELQGLLPMCAWCQKVRNDQGYWEGLAAYVSHHMGTQWTHGMCPDCYYKLLHEPIA